MTSRCHCGDTAGTGHRGDGAGQGRRQDIGGGVGTSMSTQSWLLGGDPVHTHRSSGMLGSAQVSLVGAYHSSGGCGDKPALVPRVRAIQHVQHHHWLLPSLSWAELIPAWLGFWQLHSSRMGPMQVCLGSPGMGMLTVTHLGDAHCHTSQGCSLSHIWLGSGWSLGLLGQLSWDH